jgi:hypothetical protein
MQMVIERFWHGHLELPPPPRPELSDPQEKDRLREHHERIVRALDWAEHDGERSPEH